MNAWSSCVPVYGLNFGGKGSLGKDKGDENLSVVINSLSLAATCVCMTFVVYVLYFLSWYYE